MADELITVRLPGIADRIMKEGSYPKDEPERWHRYRAMRTVRVTGRPHGFAAIVRLPAGDWADVLDYLTGCLRCMAGMSAKERGEGGKAELRALRIAVERITAALESARESG